MCLIIDSNISGFDDIQQIIFFYKIFIYFMLKGGVYCFHFICNLDELYRRYEVFHKATFYRFRRTLSLNLVRLLIILLPNTRNLWVILNLAQINCGSSLIISFLKILCDHFSNLFVHDWRRVIITLMCYWLLMGFINLTSAISNRECCNSSVFDLHPSYAKFLAWHRLMAFTGSWKSPREKFFSLLLYITLLYLFYIFPIYFPIISHLAFFLLNEQHLQLATSLWALKFQETFRAGKRVYIDIFRCFPQTERIERSNEIA